MTIGGGDTYFAFNQAVAGRAIPEWVNSIFASLGGSAPLDYILPFPTLAWAGTVDANGQAIARAYSDATGGAIHQDGDLTLSDNIDFMYNQAEGHAYALGTGLDFQIYAGGIPGKISTRRSLPPATLLPTPAARAAAAPFTWRAAR